MMSFHGFQAMATDDNQGGARHDGKAIGPEILGNLPSIERTKGRIDGQVDKTTKDLINGRQLRVGS